MPGQEHIFLLANSVEMGDDQAMVIGMEFLNTITLAGMPPHRLALKVGVPVILLRTLDAASGFCNGTYLIIWCLTRRLIIAQIIGGWGTTKLWRLGQNFSTPLLWQVCHHIAWPSKLASLLSY
jgi:ATP-dependent DNA helicase PIF1